jgi:hypothetical protein
MSLEQAMGVSAAFGISLDQFASFKTPASAVIIAAEIVASRARLDKALQEGGAA